MIFDERGAGYEFAQYRKIVKAKLENKDYDSYAVFVHSCDEEKLLTSESVNAYTYFDIASMGKVLITSPLVLQAISRGKLSLDNTLDEFIAVNDADKKKITVKQLLTHTPGIIRHNITAEAVKKRK